MPIRPRWEAADGRPVRAVGDPAAAGRQRVFRRRGILADLRAAGPAGGAGRAGQVKRGHGDPGRRAPSADVRRRPARHHGVVDPARPRRRTRRRRPAAAPVRSVRHLPRAAAHRVVRDRAGDRGDLACPARRDGAEEHRDRRAGEGGDAADSAVPGLHSRGRGRSSRSTTGAATPPCGRCGSSPRNELDITVSTVELSRDDRRVGVGGSAGSRGTHQAHPGPADPEPDGRRRGGPCR